MIHNFARRHARPSAWRILARLALALVMGIELGLLLGIAYVLYLAATVKIPAW
jgi:hypothetical protein